jgi:hypothetical protein
VLRDEVTCANGASERAVRPGTCSANVVRLQPGQPQKNRRTVSLITTRPPPIAVSGQHQQQPGSNHDSLNHRPGQVRQKSYQLNGDTRA